MPKLGKPLNLTNKQLDEAAIITEEDIIEATKRWSATVPQWARNLLTTPKVE